MQPLFFFCFLLFFLPASPASLATSLQTSFHDLRSTHHFPVVDQSEDIISEHCMFRNNTLDSPHSTSTKQKI